MEKSFKILLKIIIAHFIIYCHLIHEFHLMVKFEQFALFIILITSLFRIKMLVLV